MLLEIQDNRLTTCWHDDRRRKGQPRTRPPFLGLLHAGECQLIDRGIDPLPMRLPTA
jgi:hypothetical protein